MIDTVRFLTRAVPDEEQLALYWRRSEVTGGSSDPAIKYIYNPDPKGPLPIRVTYRPTSLNGPNQVSIEFSLPKLLLGNNWEMLWDLQGTPPHLDARFTACAALPPLPSAAEMTISRLDICYNHQVGDDLALYIDAMSHMDFPRRDTVRFNQETVEFRGKSRKGKFYDKHAETKGEAPVGMLRQEITLQGAAAVKRALHQDSPVTLPDLTIPRLANVLARELTILGIDQRCFMNRDHAYEMLVNAYGPTRGTRLYGFFVKYQHLDRGEIARQARINRNSLSRLLADIKKAGVSLGATDNELPLPPLTIQIPDPIPPLIVKTCIQTPGVTPGSLDSEDGPGDLDQDEEEGDQDDPR